MKQTKKLPTPQEYQAVCEDYIKSLYHLQKLGLVRVAKDGASVRINPNLKEAKNE